MKTPSEYKIARFEPGSKLLQHASHESTPI